MAMDGCSRVWTSKGNFTADGSCVGKRVTMDSWEGVN